MARIARPGTEGIAIFGVAERTVEHLEGFESPDGQFRRLVVQEVVACSQLFVNIRL